MPENDGFKPGNSKRGRPLKVDKLDEYIKHHTENEQAKYPDKKISDMATKAFGVKVGETTIWDHREKLGIKPCNEHGGDRKTPKYEEVPGLSRSLDPEAPQTQEELDKYYIWYDKNKKPLCKKKGSSDADLVWTMLAQTLATEGGIDDMLKKKDKNGNLVYSSEVRSMVRQAYSQRFIPDQIEIIDDLTYSPGCGKTGHQGGHSGRTEKISRIG